MTPSQRIRRQILISAGFKDEAKAATAETIDDVYLEVYVREHLQEDQDAFRSSGTDTQIPCGGSRHYESRSKAKQLDDGTWVGWTYWYGGGKHSEPGAVDWISDAYDVEIVERKMVEVLVYAKVEPKEPV